MPRDEQYLVEIVEAADDIVRWLGEVEFDEWSANDILQSAVLLKLITIGELRAEFPEVAARYKGRG